MKTPTLSRLASIVSLASPLAQAIYRALLAEFPTSTAVVTLDRLADAIGAQAVTLADIEAIIEALEASGRRVEAELKDPPIALARVLATVRSFSAAAGRRPTLLEIAQQSGQSLAEVRFALLYARVLVR
jgi:hypothetical protein